MRLRSRRQRLTVGALSAVALVLALAGVDAAKLAAALVQDRAAVERGYHQHRTGAKAAFEEALPRAAIERLVQLDAKKEAVLKRAYGVEVSEAEVKAEVERINAAEARLRRVAGSAAGMTAFDPSRSGCATSTARVLPGWRNRLLPPPG